MKRCRVVCDTAAGLLDCELELPATATIAEALEQARRMLGPECAPAGSATGVYGLLRPAEYVPGDGDRIEVYRALLVDPRVRRREREGARRRGAARRP